MKLFRSIVVVTLIFFAQVTLAQVSNVEGIKPLEGVTIPKGNGAKSTGTTGNAEILQGSKSDDGYGRRVAALIKSNTVLPPLYDISNNPPVIFDFQLLPDGSPREITMVKSSGIGAFDEAVRSAIEKTLFPPDPTSGKVPSDRVVIRHRPKD